MPQHRITVDLLWPTIIPYELWIDLLDRQELYVSAVESRTSFWAGWTRSADLPPTPSPAELLAALQGENAFAMAIWSGGVVHESVPAGEQAVLGASSPFRLVQRSAAVIMNDYRQFQLIFRFELSADETRDPASLASAATDAIIAVNRHRTVLANLGQEPWADRVRNLARQEVERVVQSALGPDASVSPVRDIRFVDGGTYPLTMTDIGHLGPLESVFAEQESPTLMREQPAITHDVAGAFGHFGWSFSVLSGIPRERADRLVPLLAFMQFDYFQVNYFREYGLVSMQAASGKERRKALERRAARFERFSFHFQRFLLATERYVSERRPLYGDVALRIQSFWNLPRGVEAVGRAFETQRGYLQRRASKAEEKALKRQGVALYVIALLGLLGLYPTADVVLKLRLEHPGLTYGISGVCALGLVLGLWLLLRPADPA